MSIASQLCPDLASLNRTKFQPRRILKLRYPKSEYYIVRYVYLFSQLILTGKFCDSSHRHRRKSDAGCTIQADFCGF
jgi:hypothetical protein